MDNLFSQLTQTISRAQTLEEVTRPFLELLGSITGMESTYLTRIDLGQQEQEILYARNAAQLQMTEGLKVPWHNTLCKRALDSQQFYTDDVRQCWPDAHTAHELGIHSYLTTPIQLSDGTLYGTLCAASEKQLPLSEDAARLLPLLAALIAQSVERERLIQQLVHLNHLLTLESALDSLTGLPNRRTLQHELTRLLQVGERQGFFVLVAYIDLDGFKTINDQYGHATGDLFLQSVAQRLQRTLRASDMACRVGGDEFVVIGPGPQDKDHAPSAVSALEQRLHRAIEGSYSLGQWTLDYPGASIACVVAVPGQTDAQSAIDHADQAMYVVKKQRKAQRL